MPWAQTWRSADATGQARLRVVSDLILSSEKPVRASAGCRSTHVAEGERAWTRFWC